MMNTMSSFQAVTRDRRQSITEPELLALAALRVVFVFFRFEYGDAKGRFCPRDGVAKSEAHSQRAVAAREALSSHVVASSQTRREARLPSWRKPQETPARASVRSHGRGAVCSPWNRSATR